MERRAVDLFTCIQIMHVVSILSNRDGQFGRFSAVILAAANDGHLRTQKFETTLSCQISNGHK